MVEEILPPSKGTSLEPKQEARLANGQFGPGNGGRPKGSQNKGSKQIRSAIEHALMASNASGDGTILDEVVKSVVVAALTGDIQAAAMLFGYWGGRPRQQAEDTSKDIAPAVNMLLELARNGEKSGFRPREEIRDKDDE